LAYSKLEEKFWIAKESLMYLTEESFLDSTLISYTRFKYRSTCVKRGILSNQFFYFYDLLRRVPQFSRSRRGNCADIRMLQYNLLKNSTIEKLLEKYYNQISKELTYILDDGLYYSLSSFFIGTGWSCRQNF